MVKEATCPRNTLFGGQKTVGHWYILLGFMTQAIFKDTVWPMWPDSQKQERSFNLQMPPLLAYRQKPWLLFKKTKQNKKQQGEGTTLKRVATYTKLQMN